MKEVRCVTEELLRLVLQHHGQRKASREAEAGRKHVVQEVEGKNGLDQHRTSIAAAAVVEQGGLMQRVLGMTEERAGGKEAGQQQVYDVGSGQVENLVIPFSEIEHAPGRSRIMGRQLNVILLGKTLRCLRASRTNKSAAQKRLLYCRQT